MPNIIHKFKDDAQTLFKTLFNAFSAMDFHNVFHLLGEWSVQGLCWALQPAGDVRCSTKHVFKGQGLLSDSAPKDQQSRWPAEWVMTRRKHRTQEETTAEGKKKKMRGHENITGVTCAQETITYMPSGLYVILFVLCSSPALVIVWLSSSLPCYHSSLVCI